MINDLNNYYAHHFLQHEKIPHFAHRVNLCVVYKFQIKQRLFPTRPTCLKYLYILFQSLKHGDKRDGSTSNIT